LKSLVKEFPSVPFPDPGIPETKTSLTLSDVSKSNPLVFFFVKD